MYKLLTISLLLYAANVNNAEAQTDNIAQTKKTIAKSQSQITRQKAEEVAMLVMAPYIYDNNTTTMAVQCSRQDLQAAIDEVSSSGGGMIIIPQGEHFMDGPLVMKSGVRLHLADGATLKFSSNPDAYLPVVATRWEGTELYGRSSMIYAHGQHDIIITGEGCAVIDA